MSSALRSRAAAAAAPSPWRLWRTGRWAARDKIDEPLVLQFRRPDQIASGGTSGRQDWRDLLNQTVEGVTV
jgi:hypothetical protein